MKHITEEQIQEILFENGRFPDLENSHIDQCGFCQKRIEEYKIIFRTLNIEMKPSFDNKIDVLIMQRIHSFDSKRKVYKYAIKLCVSFIILFVLIGLLYYFEFKPGYNFTIDINAIFTFMVFIVVGFVTCLHLFDNINSYAIKRKALLS
jgi:hypothetical protein